MAGLMVWFALCGVVLIALLGMTLNASRSSLELSADARETRAVDAALESAITQIRMDPAGEVGAASATGDCERPVGDGTAGSDGLAYVDRDGTEVVVTAECEEASRRIPDPAPGEPASARLDVVGGTYRSPAALADTIDWASDCGPGATDCYPWRTAVGGPNFAANSAAIAALNPTVVHTSDPSVAPADATLDLAADVTVARGAVPLVNPPREDRAVGISVAGSYRQGDAGPFASVGGTDSCGMLGPGFPWLVPGGRVLDGDDPSGAPSCAAAVAPLTDGLAAPTSWNAMTPRPAVPACPAGAGSVATLSPGAYTRDRTAALNDLLGGACPGRVFWFQPGDYWFDVDDASNPAGLRNALLIDDPTVRVVMGRPAGGDGAAAAAAAPFPEACDRAAPGVSVTLSPRTTLRHLQGRVAVCDRAVSGSASTLPPAVWQTPAADGGWAGTPDPARSALLLTQDNSWISWGSAGLVGEGDAWAMDGRNATATFGCSVFLFGGCGADVNVSAQGVGAATPEPPAAVAASRVRSLDLLVKAAARNESSFTASLVGGGQASTQVTLYRAGAATPVCAVGFPSVPDARAGAGFQNTYSYDLFSPQAEAVAGAPRCVDVRDGAGLTRADLRGARVDLRIRLYTWVTFFGFFDTVVELDGMELRAGWDLLPSGGTDGAGWSNAANIAALDGRHTGFSLTCAGNGACPTATRSMTATGLDNPTDPWVPTDGPLLAAGVVVTGETTSQNFFTNGSFYDLNGAPDSSASSWMRVTVNRPDGSRICQAQWPRIPFWGQGVYLDLLGAPGSCRATLTSAEQLLGASAVLEVFLQRNQSGANAAFGTRIDHLKISTVTGGSYTGPTAPALVTQDVRSSDGSSFNVYGPWSTPRATLNVDWRGAPPVRADGSDVPVLGGQSVVASVGSRVGAGGAAGVLCCAGTRPAERIVTLTAHTVGDDGSRRPAAVARVRVSDVGGNGSSVRVEDWDLS
jgi:hypothetical protein